MRGLWSRTIWAEGAIPPAEYKYRNLKRVLFPVLYATLLLTGLTSARYGLPTLLQFYTADGVKFFSFTVSGLAFVSFIGLALPRLWAVEVAACGLLFGFIGALVAALTLLTAQGSDGRGYIITFAFFAACVLLYRLSLLASEWQDRTIAKKKAGR